MCDSVTLDVVSPYLDVLRAMGIHGQPLFDCVAAMIALDAERCWWRTET